MDPDERILTTIPQNECAKRFVRRDGGNVPQHKAWSSFARHPLRYNPYLKLEERKLRLDSSEKRRMKGIRTGNGFEDEEELDGKRDPFGWQETFVISL